MFNFINLDFNRVVVGLVGAILFSTTFVGAAVAPAHAVEAVAEAGA